MFLSAVSLYGPAQEICFFMFLHLVPHPNPKHPWPPWRVVEGHEPGTARSHWPHRDRRWKSRSRGEKKKCPEDQLTQGRKPPRHGSLVCWLCLNDSPKKQGCVPHTRLSEPVVGRSRLYKAVFKNRSLEPQTCCEAGSSSFDRPSTSAALCPSTSDAASRSPPRRRLWV